jgi:hypothetical protein
MRRKLTYSGSVMDTSDTPRDPRNPCDFAIRTSCRIAFSFNAARSPVKLGIVQLITPTSVLRAQRRASSLP